MLVAEALARLHTHGSSPKTPFLADAISTNISCTCPFNLDITVKQPVQIRLCTNSAVKILLSLNQCISRSFAKVIVAKLLKLQL